MAVTKDEFIIISTKEPELLISTKPYKLQQFHDVCMGYAMPQSS